MSLLLALLLQDVAKEVEYANNSEKPQYQAQAMERLKKRGLDAVPAILEFVEKKGRNALAMFFTEFLGELKDERVSKLLVEMLGDKEFFWRPAAAKALWLHGRAEDLALFRTLLGDHLWGVRFFAIRGVEKLADKESMPKLRELLNDDQYDVRAQAAKTLYNFGDDGGLPVLVESLSSSVVWFEIDYGQIAREDSWKFLKAITKDDFGFKPWEPDEQRVPGLRRWHDWMAARDPKWRDKVPARARVVPEKTEHVFGFELRSCQRGEFFFRISKEGEFVLGFFNLERVRLTDDERAKLQAAIDAVGKIDRSVPYGRGGCDFEMYYFQANGGFEKLWIGLGGRPVAGDVFSRTIAEILKAHWGEGMANEFAEMTKLFRSN